MNQPPIEYLFITSAPLISIDGYVTTVGASARLGSLGPTRALMRLGYDARTFSTSGDSAAVERAAASAKHVVFGEMFPAQGGWAEPAAADQRVLAAVAQRRERVIFTLADDHFDNEEFRRFYAEALRECLCVTTVSPQLAATVGTFTSRPVRVAPEPCEGERGAPQAFSARRPAGPLAWLARRIGLSRDLWRARLLWFGYPQNLPPLLELVPALERLALRHPLTLTCVTRPVAEIPELMTPARTSEDSALRVEFIPWTPLAVESAIAGSDIVLIPSAWRDPVRQAKSPNRLVSGLHGGRFVVAHPLPAYAPYAEFAWIGEDLVQGVEWAIEHPREVLMRIGRGQSFIDQRHSPEAVARFWLDVFDTKT
jgi:glycosyltransferase involved in cell wall biosynthesis